MNCTRTATVLAEQKNITVAPASQKVPITIVGDRVRLRQLFLNLVDNAIKYTPEGGTVTLAVRRQNGAALFEVQDTGIGIPPGEIEKIFDRFYRVDKARSREHGGYRAWAFDREVDRGTAPRDDQRDQRGEQGINVYRDAAVKLMSRGQSEFPSSFYPLRSSLFLLRSPLFPLKVRPEREVILRLREPVVIPGPGNIKPHQEGKEEDAGTGAHTHQEIPRDSISS